MRGFASLRIGSNCGHFAEPARDRSQLADPGGADPVVVRDQDTSAYGILLCAFCMGGTAAALHRRRKFRNDPAASPALIC